MTKNPFFENWLKSDLTKSLPGFGAPVDMSTLMESGRKTFQALTEAQQIAIESMQTIAQRQSEILSQFVQDQSAIARDIVNEGTPEEKVARSAELMRRNYEKTINATREVADMLGKSTREASDIINKRVTAALSEIKDSVEEAPSSKKSSKAA